MRESFQSFDGRLVLVGHCQWPVSLNSDGQVGEGSSHEWAFWWLEEDALCFGGFDGRLCCRLVEEGDGAWQGQLTRDPQVALQLVPAEGFDRIKRLAATQDARPGDGIALVGNVHFQDGIGKAILVADHLREDGANLRFVAAGRYAPESFPDAGFAQYIRRHTVPRQQVPASSAVFAYLPPPDSAAAMPAVRSPRVCFTMFEADRAPAGWDDACRQFDQILCPAPFFVDALRNSGIRTAAAVVPLGVVEPPSTCRLAEPHRPFVFATSNSASPRKNLDGLIRAFLAAFPLAATKKGSGTDCRNGPAGAAHNRFLTPFSHVRLVIQARWGSRRQDIEALADSDPRIEFQWSDLTDEQYEAWWDSIDCYVALSKAEGYGLTPREAILRGLPVIASDNSGHATIPREYFFPVPSIGMEPAYCDYWKEPVGRYWTPNLAVGAEQMRCIYENYDEALARPRRAKADRWAEQISFKAMADRVLPYLRPQVILLCPSLGKDCGIAEYTRYVQRELVEAGIGCLVVDNVRRARELALATASVTHVIVQHEYALFDGRNPRLGEGDSTGLVIHELKRIETARPDVAAFVLMHTYSEFALEEGVNRQLVESGLRLFHFTRAGAERLGGEFFEHGVPQVESAAEAPSSSALPASGRENRRDGQLTIGNFGFFGTHRDIAALVEVCRRTGSRFVGNFRCDDPAAQAEALRLFVDAGVDADLAWGFPKDTELFALLSQCDVLYMPRRDNGLWNASGSARLAMNLRRPIIVNRARCYADLQHVLCLADTVDEAVQWTLRLRNPHEHAAAVARIDEFARQQSIGNVYRELLTATRQSTPPSDVASREECGDADLQATEPSAV